MTLVTMESLSNDNHSKGQRARLTCTECYRRKIKCDKHVPCSTCIKRGLKDYCTRSDIDFQTRSSPALRTPIPEAAQTSELIQRLINRVSNLENLIQEKDNAHDYPPVTSVALAKQTQTDPVALLPTTIAVVDQEDPQIADAATVLEFLAWGRRKDQDFHDAPENESGPRRHSIAQEEVPIANHLTDSITTPQLDFLEALLPNKQHVSQLVDFHERCLIWYHGSYMAMTLANDVNTFYANYKGNIRHPEVNLQWVALLFAALTGSITCASPSVATSWGFKRAERSQLSKQWYNATVNCLNLSNYLEMHTVYSVQAISTLTISAHILGFSNSQSVLLAAAARIAQSLGLHRLGEEDVAAEISSESQLKRRRKRETGRRVWCQLCTQDWFSCPFSESYSLNSKFFSTTKPLNCHDNDMMPLPKTTPTVTSYCNYLYDIAYLIPQLQDAMASSNTLYTKYEQVLQHDEKMRKLATAYMPTFLSSNAPVSSTWPVYVPWARRSLAICAAHKIIMIHRKFLGLSFTNSAFVFTRRTCIAASKTILKEARAAYDDNGPVLWIDQAFVVAASIILSLDAFHRKPDEDQFSEHKRLAEQAIEYLSQFQDSKIATRGVQLLGFLTTELSTVLEDEIVHNSSKRTREPDASEDVRRGKRARVFNLSTFMNSMSSECQISTPATEGTNTAADIAWDAFADMFPPQTGFGGDNLFDNFFAFE